MWSLRAGLRGACAESTNAVVAAHGTLEHTLIRDVGTINVPP